MNRGDHGANADNNMAALHGQAIPGNFQQRQPMDGFNPGNNK